jgi:glycine cleavage system H protein
MEKNFFSNVILAEENNMADMKFVKTHEWVCLEDDGMATIGITDHAQHALGDMVFVELPDIGEIINIGKECAVVESVKSASDIYAPVSGEVVAINEAVVANPEIINQDPQAEGWLFKVRPSGPKELNDLMDAKAYESYLAEIAH